MPWLSLWNISLVLSCRYSTNGADFWLLFGNQGLPNPSVWWVYRSVMVYWSNEWPETVKLGCWSGYHKKITIRHFFWDTLYWCIDNKMRCVVIKLYNITGRNVSEEKSFTFLRLLLFQHLTRHVRLKEVSRPDHQLYIYKWNIILLRSINQNTEKVIWGLAWETFLDR